MFVYTCESNFACVIPDKVTGVSLYDITVISLVSQYFGELFQINILYRNIVHIVQREQKY